MATTTKRCPGFEGIDQPAHDLPADVANFNSNAGSKDGLSTRCRACGNAYGKAWAARDRAIKAADAVDTNFGGGVIRDRALDEARNATVAQYAKGFKPVLALAATAELGSGPDWAGEHELTAGLHHGLAGPGTSAYTSCPTCIAARAVTAPAKPRPSEQAMAEARGWTIEVVAGVEYRVPTDTDTVATPEGQAALEAVNEAQAAERRRRDAERKRNERAAAKAKAATTA